VNSHIVYCVFVQLTQPVTFRWLWTKFMGWRRHCHCHRACPSSWCLDLIGPKSW